MMTLLDQAMSVLANTPSETVRLLADIGSAGDGTSNGAIMSIVLKAQLACAAVLVGLFCWRVVGVYAEKGGEHASKMGGAGAPGRDKKLGEELKYFGIAGAFIVLAYPLFDIITSIANGAVN